MTHYFDSDVDVKSEIAEFTYHLGDENFIFKTDHGVFSRGAMDYASYLLISGVLKFDLGKEILDYGCGWGPVGIILKRLHPEYDLTLVDINRRAVDLAKINSKVNRTPVEVYQSEDISSLNKTFDTVILNPPIRAGKTAIYGMYQKAHDNLRIGGSLYVVVKIKHGARSHFERLKELFKTCTVFKKEDGHYLIKATR